MEFELIHDEKNYKNDMIRYVVHGIQSDLFFKYFVLLFFLILSFHLLNHFEFITFLGRVFKVLTISIGTGVIGMTLYSLFYFTISINKIKKNTAFIPKMTKVKFYEDYFEYRNTYFSVKKNWNEINEALVLNDTMYLVSVNKKESPIIINSKELEASQNFDTILNYIKDKWQPSI